MPPPAGSLQARLSQIEAIFAAGDREKARAMAQRVVQSAPKDPRANLMMGRILERIGQAQTALFYAERAAEGLADEAMAHSLLAAILLRLKRTNEALASARRARAIAPDAPEHRFHEAAALSALGRMREAIEACTLNGEVMVQSAPLASCAANAMVHLGLYEEGSRLYARASEAHPNDVSLASSLCNSMNYAPGLSREAVFEAHRRFGKITERVHPRSKAPLLNSDPDRAIRVGIVSPDLHRHSVAFFIAPLFEHHDRSRVELVAYAVGASSRADDVTARLRSQSDGWRDVGVTTWSAFAERIRSDRIDVLVELSGHTASGTLSLAPYGPAPIQVSYLGYPGTTGLSCMDYRLVDSITDPVPDADAFATERLVRLDPCFLCYSPLPGAPEVASPPHSANGRITFGSFNAAQKINEPLVALWSRLLKEVGDSRMILKTAAFSDPVVRERFVALFARHNIPSERIEILPSQDRIEDHLSLYSRMDIALDTFPYHGTTTTCEALHMGVPVVSLLGDRHVSRVGASLLSAAGLADCIARSEEEFVAIGASLARDPIRLAGLRSTLRARLLASPLCDGPAFCRRFESAMRQIWRDACKPTPHQISRPAG